jgi:hypothetical protein
VYSTRTEEYYKGWVAFGPGAGGPGAVGTEATGQPQHDSHHILVNLRGGGGPCECAEAADAVDVVDAGGLDDVGD